ncbi:unnamed protein product [Hermetia illucens]|uniref:Uncharacterized protein n=1 Tax=Hermetia illucens TaxID=343691 RepID=A0A7R8YNQ1_HERIL|nr:uncharacterized protein LOC119660619 [Hermetia illucens]CAD7079896.1 unnamed protein product [Hermetia illucens]
MTSNDISESTQRLREKIRVFQAAERNSRREDDTDSMRLGLGEISQLIEELENLTEKDVTGLASRIKRKKHASYDDMFRLSHAFLQSVENIATFVKIPGALNVIVKELTGSDAKSQVIACETLCNLSLGDSVPCEKIATAAGSYLITHLDSSELRLKRTSLWVLTNILATDGKGISTLLSQEIASKLVHLYLECKYPELEDDILLAIDILLEKDANVIDANDQSKLYDSLRTKQPHKGLHLNVLFMILFRANSVSLETENFERTSELVEIAINTLNAAEHLNSQDNILKVLYSIRILGNLFAKCPDCFVAVEKLCPSLSSLVNKVLSWNNKTINKELLWLVKNTISCQTALNRPGNVLKELQVSRLTIF